MYQIQRFSNSIASQLFSGYVYRILMFASTIILLAISNSSLAAQICPSGHKMYYLGDKTPTHTPNEKLPLSWSGGTGNASTTYTFSDGTIFTLSFSDTSNLQTGYPSYSSYPSVTNSAINMFHNSQKAAINHRLLGSINKSVSKYGFIVQDLDTNEASKYIESLSLVTANGVFSNLRSGYLTQSGSTVSGTKWNNCSTTNSCDFNVDWSNSQTANTPFVVTHGNSYDLATTTSLGGHLMGYSDFYFCIAPTTYTFTGFVFNDNGGVLKSNIEPKTKFDVSSKFTSNSSYFNGIFDRSNEVGIGTTSGLSVSLTDCKGNNISTITSNTNPQTNLNSPLGQFKFTVPSNAIANLPVKEVCLVQTEPDPWTFSVDTTPNIRKIDLTKNPNRFDYKTDDLLNLDFGEVETDYASLVLVKSQYVNNCDINANYDGTNGTSSQTPIFSSDSITNIEPGKCIAYRIEAYNRGHVDLEDIRISDELQTKAQGGLVNSVFAFPAPKGDPTSLYTRTTLPTGTITSELFKLDKPTGAAPTKATLYFNTKYGTTVDP
ncbi:hypothetical protein [Psychrobacter sp. 219-2-C]|uniref:hypothetical protein n=1 Tax=Psychrobacter sp. 219-2-C TaxID=3414707 RepID=UPI003C6DD9D7